VSSACLYTYSCHCSDWALVRSVYDAGPSS